MKLTVHGIVRIIVPTFVLVAITACGGGSTTTPTQPSATHLRLTAPPTVVARSSMTVDVTALDDANNPVASYDGSVRITSSDGQALLPAAAVVLSGGHGAFHVTLESIGMQTVTATDTARASIAGTSSSIEVSAAEGLTITSGSPPGGIVGYAYNHPRCYYGHCSAFLLSASGGDGNYTWTWAAASGSSLPPGLSITDNRIGGTPPVGSVGSYNVVITVTDGGTPAAQASLPYTITIVNPPPPVIAALPGPPGATLNQPYSYQFQVSGLAPFNITASGDLPPGLAPVTATGLLAGTPSAADLYPIKVHATDPIGQSGSQDFTIGVFQHGFSPTGSTQENRWLNTATLLANGQVLITGGLLQDVGTISSELFNPADGHFSLTGDMQIGRYQHTATLLCDLDGGSCANPKVLVVGGSPESNAAGSAELYDPAAGTFALTVGRLVTPRVNHTATLLRSGKVLILGGTGTGADASVLAKAELFDPATGTFSATASPMTSRRIFHTATLLHDGKVLIVGGVDAGGLPVALAEIYDPVANTFSTIASPMTKVRSAHTATLLPSGKVLIAGGDDAANGATAEIYDPAAVAPAASFTATGALVTPRLGHTAVLLPSGQVLLVGGNYQSQFLQHAELYDPASGSFTATGGMKYARFGQTMTVLGSSGQVLVVGGVTGSLSGTEYIGVAEIYQ